MLNNLGILGAEGFRYKSVSLSVLELTFGIFFIKSIQMKQKQLT